LTSLDQTKHALKIDIKT